MESKTIGSQISPLKARVVSIILSLSLLAGMEITAGKLYHEDRELPKILDLLEQDHNLFWKMRPHLDVPFHGVRVVTNELGFREKNVPLEKKSGVLRILCLGASPTFGWGVGETDRYSNVLHEMLGESASAGKNIEIVNAAVIGYSSYQGAVLLKKVMPILKPDVVVVPFAVNDVDKYRFFLNNGKSDREVIPPSRGRLFIENVLAKSGLVKVLRRMIFGWNSDNAELRIKARLPDTDTRRVSAADYRDNLLTILETAKQQGAKVILMKMPVYDPFYGSPTVSDLGRMKAEELFAAGIRQAESGDRIAACNTLKKALEYDPDSAKMYNVIGRLYYRLNNKKQSRFYFDEAKKMELRTCIANIKEYGDIMVKVGAQSGVPLADVAARFEAVPRKDVASLYVDPERDVVHFSPQGHRIIAEELCRVISENAVPGKTERRPLKI